MDRGKFPLPLGLLLSGLLLLGLYSLSGPDASRGADLLGSGPLKENLDLPYNAVGEGGDDDEDAPEIVLFYGQSYEASAVVFALDESGSMRDQGRWQLQTREVVRSIMELGKNAEFGVVYYGSRVSAFRERLLPATTDAKGAGITWVRARNPAGDTCIAEGVVKALQIVRKSGNKYKAVIVTSDGRPDVCATGDLATPREIPILYQKTLDANPGRSVRVHTIFVGRGTDRQAMDFLRRLAQIHGGTFRAVSG